MLKDRAPKDRQSNRRSRLLRVVNVVLVQKRRREDFEWENASENRAVQVNRPYLRASILQPFDVDRASAHIPLDFAGSARAQGCRAGTFPHSQSSSGVEPLAKGTPSCEANRALAALAGQIIDCRQLTTKARLSSRNAVETAFNGHRGPRF